MPRRRPRSLLRCLWPPHAPLPSPPHVLPYPLHQRNDFGLLEKCLINHSSSQIDLKRSILERFGHPLHHFFPVASEIGVSKNSKFEFLEPNLGYKRRTSVLIKTI
ncbi:hypothetical protein AABB24_020315 [Solanum stoloniferum]|uniref:Uncharacterized protein n=1 Tax=Solanum stoloniferum TaxID=62892 RepID=A0ABD2T7D9_9SOLN